MNWIISYQKSPINGYVELKVRHEEYLTYKAYRGFFFRIKGAIFRDKEPVEIPFSLGAPVISIYPLAQCVLITFVSGVMPTSEIQAEIEQLAAEFLGQKTPEELAAAKEEAKVRTEAFHAQQRAYGYEEYPE